MRKAGNASLFCVPPGGSEPTFLPNGAVVTSETADVAHRSLLGDKPGGIGVGRMVPVGQRCGSADLPHVLFHIDSLLWLLVAIVLMEGSPPAGSEQADPEVGTWTLDPAKSTYQPGPPLKSQVRTIEEAGEEQRLHNVTVTADETLAIVEYTAKFDGKDYPVTGSPYGDTVTLKRVDSHTVEAIVKKDGRVVLTDRRLVSNDRKVLTITQTGMSPNGRSMYNVLVYKKTDT